ncbi:MAG: FtsX-like permease family protein [Planctomycetota bacterium]|nr:FtsX-like permease family protein [Planctomycetota bacterium]
MTSWRLVIRSLTFHWRVHAAVVLGVAAATAVLTGALLVGDSVRGSLRGLVLDRLGKIDALLISPRFFRSELASQLAEKPSFNERYDQAIPAILFPQGTVEHTIDDRVSRASRILIIATPSSFWKLDTKAMRPAVLPGEDEVVLNEPLARELGVTVGSSITLRLPEAANAIPAESPLGEKEDRVRGIPGLKVVAIVPADGLGRFGLTPSQSLPMVAFTHLATVQDALRLEGQVNALMVSSVGNHPPPNAEDCLELNRLLKPRLGDYGLSLTQIRLPLSVDNTNHDKLILDYTSLTSDRMILDDEVASVATNAFAGFSAQGVLTYLANALIPLDDQGQETPGGGVPYSTVAAVDSRAPLGPLLGPDGEPLPPLADDEIIVNSWVAEDQGLVAGGRLRVYYYLPETTDRQPQETYRDFKVKAIVPITTPAKPFSGKRPAVYDQPPTLVNDKDLTPEVRGVTDQDSIENWDTPFDLEREVRAQDERYYDLHRLTPKAFVSLSTGQSLWGSRFGAHTSWRIPTPSSLPGNDAQAFRQQLEDAFLQQAEKSQARLGLAFQPIKWQGLKAASGTTPFDVLFIALSSFLIAAALMLVSLLFRLGVDQRADQLGLLLAVGIPRAQTARLLRREGTLVAAAGSLLGVGLGVGYAWLMLAGLRTVWLGAVVTPFLVFHASTVSLIAGYLLGILVCSLTIGHAVQRLKQIPARRLLAGLASAEPQHQASQSKWGHKSGWCLLAIALVLAVAATQLGGEAQAGAFVAGGAAVLTGLLLLFRQRLEQIPSGGLDATLSLSRLAISSARRNPGRSSLTVGLIASASFLIAAMSSFRLDASLEGAGGFESIAESSLPVFVDLNAPVGREELLGADENAKLAESVILPLRVRPGDDASCNNLYSAQRPRVLGVPPALGRHFDQADTSFSWGPTLAETDEEQKNPWKLLDRPKQDGAIPVVIDQNTAMFSLGIYAPGSHASFDYDGVQLDLYVVGFLKNSVLQGNLLISEAHFQDRFPDIAGYRYFLIHSPDGQTQAASLLEDALSDQGFDARASREVLDSLLAVQNTYLSTFQSLGALGLLLGTFGLSTVQLRNVLERRAELALLRASGFQHRRVGRMVLWENLFLLLGGLGLGILAAFYAVMPHILLGDAAISADRFGRDLAIMLALVVAAGLLTGLIAVRWTVRAPLIAALRGD